MYGCREFHEGQLDKKGNPYYEHPYWVGCHICMWLETNVSSRMFFIHEAVGFLHDVLEDTNYTLEDIFKKNENWDKLTRKLIGDALIAITRNKDESYWDYIKRCQKNSIASTVKMVDLTHNILRCRKDKNWSLANRYYKALGYLVFKEKAGFYASV